MAEASDRDRPEALLRAGRQRGPSKLGNGAMP